MTRERLEDEVPLLLRLPDELLEAIVFHLPPRATIAFGKTCRRTEKITREPLVWRRHCIRTWRHWDKRHGLEERLRLPPSQTKWQRLYKERQKVDQDALELFDNLLLAQQYRLQRMEEIASHRYDVKDVLLRLRDETSDAAEDVLARRYHANAILGRIHRATALEKWTDLQHGQAVAVEEVLGAYDLFVLSGGQGDLADVEKEFDRIAKAIRSRDPEFDELTTRKKAVQVARYLRSENLVGNPDEEEYHALHNNFISLAIFQSPHTSLPLQSVAIYCAIARRCGISAGPSKYPEHVYAVIEAPSDSTLDGKPKVPVEGADAELMYLDPWRDSEEVPRDQLRLRLTQMGVTPAQHHEYLSVANTREITLRAGRNIMTSVQHIHQRRQRALRLPFLPDIEAAWYAMLWSMLILGDTNDATTLQRRRQCLPYFLDNFQMHFTEDIGLIETHILPMFEGEHEHHGLLELVSSARLADQTRKAPQPRNAASRDVNFKVGTPFLHRRYGYEGVITGWDPRCHAGHDWIQQMQVDELPRGTEQPFYNIVADDKSVRYVAEENIAVKHEQPSERIMRLAGRYFKRWDEPSKTFTSNLKEQYPDD